MGSRKHFSPNFIVIVIAIVLAGLTGCSSGNSGSSSNLGRETRADGTVPSKTSPSVSSVPTVSDIGYPDHEPGTADVSTMERGKPFVATPNFHYFTACGRPCWLPLYPTPQLVLGRKVTDHFPFEALAAQSGNGVRVVCQVKSDVELSVNDQLTQKYRLINEAGQTSNLWDKVIVPDEALRPPGEKGTFSIKGLDPTPDHQGHFAYGADIWFGNTGDHGIPCH